MKFDDLTGELNRLTAAEVAENIRKSALPASPADYKAELPKDFKPPQGIEFKIDEADPLMVQARELMHDISHGKVSGQEAFSKMLSLYAGARVADAAKYQAAVNAEIAKLGPTGSARVTAINTWLDAMGVGRFKSNVQTADDVADLETIITKSTNSGAASYTQAGRQPPANTGKIDGYDKMSFEQKRNAQDQLRIASAR